MKNNLEVLQQKEKEFWRIRSRSNWLAFGDKNAKYFHHHASQRRSKNYIDKLEDESGNRKRS